MKRFKFIKLNHSQILKLSKKILSKNEELKNTITSMEKITDELTEQKSYINEIYNKSNTAIVIWNDSLIENYTRNESIIFSFGMDVTNQRAQERKIIEMTYTDKWTGLENQAMFEKDVMHLINRKEPFTIYLVDIDNFRTLNLLRTYSKKRWVWGEVEFHYTISIGVTKFPIEGFDIFTLLKNTEMALNKAKK